MPYEKLTLETNIPQTIALKFTQGKEVEGNFGPQIRFTLADGRNWYAPPVVAEKVDDLQLQTEEPFIVCKREQKGPSGKKQTIYTVERAEASVKQTHSPAPERKPAPTAATGEQVVTEQQKQVTSTVETVTLRKYSPDAKRYMVAFADALDVIHEVAPYAKKRGYEFHFGPEDLRAIATTLFINSPREARS